MATLILICGVAGAGKTTLARQLEESLQAFRLSPDEWIKVVIRNESDKRELTRLRDPVESLQWQAAKKLLCLGVPVILENGFWGKEERARFRSEAKTLGARVELCYLDVSKKEAWTRIESRNFELPEGSFQIARDEFDSWWTSFTPSDPEEVKCYDAYHRVEVVQMGGALH